MSDSSSASSDRCRLDDGLPEGRDDTAPGKKSTASLVAERARRTESEPIAESRSRDRHPAPGNPESEDPAIVNARAELQRDSFVSSVYLLLALTVIQKGLGFVRSIVICQNLSPEQLGMWSMTLTFVETLVPLLILSIPASFGRYFAQYESKGQLRAFIQQSICLMVCCFVGGLILLAWFRAPLAEWIYGDAQHTAMLATGLLVLVPFGIFGVLASILTGLRKSQTRTISEFINGVSFTVLAVTVVLLGQASAFSLAFAFATAYALASGYSLIRVSGMYRYLGEDQQPLVWKGTWLRLAPVIFVFWLSDFLTNLFFTIDRYMIINLSPARFGEPLEQVGNYEAAHVMPLLLMSFMAIVSKLILPYLSADWESGRRRLVSTKINLSVKLGGLALLGAATSFVLISDFLFDFLFRGKFPGGLEVLPFIVYFYVVSGLSFLVLNFFWCCEQGKFAILALFAGLVANVIVNASLLPTQGIVGAAIGTAFAVTTQFLILSLAARWQGLRTDWRVPVIFGCAVWLMVSPATAWLGLGGLLVLTAGGWMLTRRDRVLLVRAFRR